jgi:hypothetical protein
VTLHAATATDHASAAALFLLIGAAVTFGYLFTCWIYPFVNCRRCHGTGKQRSIFGGRSYALCRRCHGNGRQLRPGRHLLNHIRNLHDRSTPGGKR